LFVATFLGAGNVLVGRAEHGQACFGPMSVPIPEAVPHEEGAPVQMLVRPEEVALSASRPDSAPVLGHGPIIEQNFNGALRRVRLRLPRLAGVRQIAPAVPFGEEDLLVDAVIRPDTSAASDEWYVALMKWHILEQPQPRLLVCDAGGSGSLVALEAAQRLAAAAGAAINVLAVTADPQGSPNLVETLENRMREAGLQGADLRVRYGQPADQIRAEQSEALYEMMVLAANEESDKRPAILGDTLRSVLSSHVLPVLVIKSGQMDSGPLLICTAAGEPGKNVVRIGGRLARQLGVPVTLLHLTGASGKPTSIAQRHLNNSLATLRAMDVPAEIRLSAAKNAAEKILGAASDTGHAIIVVGGHGPRFRSVFGRDDVTRQVLVRSHRPVLVVPSDR
jgi:nucleotide-binding universal stress UspA family protein